MHVDFRSFLWPESFISKVTEVVALERASCRDAIMEFVPKGFFGPDLNSHLDLNDERQKILLVDLLENKPLLKKLAITGCKESTVKPACITQLFQCCSESLRELKIDYPFLSDTITFFPSCPLKNLSKFYLSNTIKNIFTETSHDKFWDFLESIGKMMPNLEEFELDLDLSGKQWSRNPWRRDDFFSSSARKLKLSLKDGTFSLVGIKAVFPHAKSLELFLSGFEHLPCREIWELWPRLEELKILGSQMTLSKNLDAEFCGIHEVEAVDLRELEWDEEYLRTVQIVPIRPSLFTMKGKSLKKIRAWLAHVASQIELLSFLLIFRFTLTFHSRRLPRPN